MSHISSIETGVLSLMRLENNFISSSQQYLFFRIVGVLRVFGDLLREKLLLFFVVGHQGVVALYQLLAAPCHFKREFITWRLPRPDWNKLSSFQEMGSFPRKVLSCATLLDSLRDLGIRFHSMLAALCSWRYPRPLSSHRRCSTFAWVNVVADDGQRDNSRRHVPHVAFESR